MTDAWPWLALAGLGAFHGLNPAMGWLFAVALGLHRQSRRVVLLSRCCRSRWAMRCRSRWSRGLLVAAGTLLPHERRADRRRPRC